MYSYIIGTIKEIKPSHVVLENNGVGFLVITPNSYYYKLNEEVCIFTYHYVREDIFNLYGFVDEDIRSLFIKLISVSGIGPKSALSILATGNTTDVMFAIANGDAKYLTKYPGIGMKSAQQIILDLKGKLDLDADELIPDNRKDVTDALVSLGYSKADIKKALKKVDPDQKIADMIKQALKILLG